MTENTDYARVILNVVFRDTGLTIMAVPTKISETEVVSFVSTDGPDAKFSPRDIKRLAEAFYEAGITEFGPGKDPERQDRRGIKLQAAAEGAKAPVFMRVPGNLVIYSPNPAFLSNMKPKLGAALRATFG